jgi:hypothetical protein
LGSNTGRSSRHIPFFRHRRLGFGILAFACTFCRFMLTCFLSELQATAKLCMRRYSSKRNQPGFTPTVTTALRTELGTTLVIGVERPHCQDGLLPLLVASSQGDETDE